MGRREAAFGEALARLFVRAGNPTLRAASSGCSRNGVSVSPQRISDWRNGRHLPREFSTVEPLLVWLTTRALRAGETGVLAIPDWKHLWTPADDADDDAAPVKASSDLRPFAGLSSLTEDDAEVYFGRDDLIAELATTIREAAAVGDGPRVVIVAGVSGSGKSSLLGAGLARAEGIPSPRTATIDDDGLRSTGPDGEGAVISLADPAAEDPEASVAPDPAIDPDEDSVPDDATAESDADEESPEDTGGPAASEPAGAVAARLERILVIDQFESVFTLSDDAVRGIVGALEEYATDTGVVVIGVRADFFGHCVEFPTLARAWQRHCVIVTEMSDTQLRTAITAPVKLAGGRIESGLADVLLNDLHAAADAGDRAGRLPLLAHVLAVTWSRRTGNRMTISGYRAAGGIARAVADTAEAAWSSIGEDDRDLARTLLMALVHVRADGAALRAPLDLATVGTRFGEDVSEIVDIFAQARLITVSDEVIMLIHDVVLTAWPRLRGWIIAGKDSLVWRQQLDVDTDAWVEADRHKSFLYTGARLELSLLQRDQVNKNYRNLLSADNDRFLDDAIDDRKHTRRLRSIAIGAVAVLAVVSMIAAGISIRQARDLEKQRNAAEHTALTSNVLSLQSANPSVAARILLSGNKLYPNDETISERILGAMSSPLATSVPGHTSAVYDLAYSRQGDLVASASGDRTVRLWATGGDAESPLTSVATLRGFKNFVTAVTIHPTRPLLAASSGDGLVRVWDISDVRKPDLVSTLKPGNGSTVYMARFSPRGDQLATSSDDGTIALFRVTGSRVADRPANVLRAHSGPARTLSYRGDGAILASGGDDQVVHLWNVADPALPVEAGPVLTGFPSITHSVAFSPSGRELAVTGDSSNAQIWDVADPQRPRPLSSALPHAPGGSWWIGFSPDGLRVMSPRLDGSVQVWNTVDARAPSTLWSMQNAPAEGTLRTFAGAVSPDGSSMVVGRDDGLIDLWRFPSGVLTGQGGAISSLDTSGDGKVIASTGTDAMLSVWTAKGADIELQGRIAMQRKVNDKPRLSVNHDGTRVATANNNGGTVQLWDIADPSRPRAAGSITTQTRYTSALAFSPRSDVLAAGINDTAVRLWSVSNAGAPQAISGHLVGPEDLIRSIAFNTDGTMLAVSADDGNTYIYDLTAVRPTQPTEPVVVIEDSNSASQVAFTKDDTIVLASRDLSAWRIDKAAGKATERARLSELYAATLSITPTRVVVGTSTHQLRTFTLGDKGWRPAAAVVPLMPQADPVPAWQLAPSVTSDAAILTSGDSSGSLYRQVIDVHDAKRWICATTPPLTKQQAADLLPHDADTDTC
ncbi:putative WD-40 repeat protein [Gordonia amarae NBRC 15530]|uniref:Putative WD-40 repeat protein n=1 Tax=Gordonia amarae NBRC 15530 TaxID=1075090 RepID=G7GQ34_9ACTN|nr:putative WD-40 repeat protein [Gordonia amarae NBRC 15530]